MEKYDTKNTAFNLQFKESAFKDKYEIVDSDGDPFLWIDKNSGRVSFGGKYFQIFNEQKLVQALDKYNAIAYEFIEKVDDGLAKSQETYSKLKEALEFSNLVIDRNRSNMMKVLDEVVKERQRQDHMRREAIQVAAVAVAFVEMLDRQVKST